MKNTYKLVLISIALVLFAAAIFVFRPVQNKLTRITVVGDSQAKIAPDTAVITFSVVTQNKQALVAQQENARKSEAVKTAVEAIAGNAKVEIKTSNYNLDPQESYDDRMPSITGYEVRNTVTIVIDDLNQTGAVIDAATKAGANSVEGIAFVVREDSPAQGDALALATRQAMAKAESIAQSLGGRIVRVVETNEGGSGVPLTSATPYYGNANTAANTAWTKTPVQAGSLDVRSQVLLVVEIEANRG